MVVLLVLAAAVFGYEKYWQKPTGEVIPTPGGVITYPNYPTSDEPPAGMPTSTPPSTGDSYQAPDPYGSQTCANRGSQVANRSGQVQWLTPKLIGTNTLFDSTGANYSGYAGDYTYLVGRFTAGKYQGADLLLAVLNISEMGVGQYWYHIVHQGKNYIVLDKYSESMVWGEGINPEVTFVEDKDFILQDLEIPETLHSDKPSADFSPVSSLGFFRNGSSFFCADDLIKVFTDAVMGDVYTDIPSPEKRSYTNGFYVKLADGRQQTYELKIDFVNKDNLPLITWNNGSKNTQEYSYKAIGGCGASQFMDVVDVTLSDLTQIGSTLDGQKIYGYKDSNSKDLKDMYEQVYTPEGQTKPSYATFLAAHPIFFWQEPFGKFVRFKTMKYLPQAECAKPVIYLYPEKTQKISVQVEPQGGMLISDPDYNNGWNVISDSYSNITNLADGKQYPYLFWEGRGGMYQTPEKGFVIKQTNVHEFLTTKLHELGLNDKEAKDFMEFWEPKMQSAPYYFVTFMGNQAMDELAPLTISPKPDTVIRILMDFTPLQQPIPVQGYVIRTPKRIGFTVVEWGGVLGSD